MAIQGYRCEAASVAGFVQQLATGYIGHGYRYYVVRKIPERKDPLRVDEKLVGLYELDLSKWARARRKRSGYANVQYIRYGSFAVLISSPPVGGHAFFRECEDYRDIRKKSIRFGGYSIGSSFSTNTGRWHASVRIEKEQYLRMRDYFVDIATKREPSALTEELGSLRFEPFARVARQYLAILGQINDKRRSAGLVELPTTCLRLHRKSIFPFGDTRAA